MDQEDQKVFHTEEESHDEFVDVENSEFADDEIWWNLQNALKCSFPPYLINLMKLNGFDSQISISQITSQDVAKMEEFAQTEMMDLIEAELASTPLSEYYGIYDKKPERFRILPGHVKLIFAMKDFLGKEPFEASSYHQMPYKRARSFHDASFADEPYNMPDPTHEVMKIFNLVKTWMTNNPQYNVSNLSVAQLEQINPTMVLLTKGGAKVRCFVCGKCVSVLRIMCKIRGSRWIISNFSRHIKTHSANADKSKHNLLMAPMPPAIYLE